MQCKVSDLVDNLSGNYNTEYKSCMERKNIKLECDFIGFKSNRLNYKCKECGKKCTKSINDAIKNFPIMYQLCNGDLNKIFLLLRKGVYPYEDMNSWEKFNETSILAREAFYSELNLEDITDRDYEHVEKVWEAFKIRNRAEYHDLNVQCDTLLLADVFENFKDKCIEIYELDPAHFLSAPGLVLQACLKKTSVNLELLTDIDMLLMVEEGIRGGICHAIHRYAKANNKYMNNYDKNIESSYLMYLDANNLYGWVMSQKLSVNGFKWTVALSKFNERFIKSYNENSDREYFLEVDVEYPKMLFNFIKIYHFYSKEKK